MLVFCYKVLNAARYTIRSIGSVPIGKSKLRYEFTADNAARGSRGTGKLFINDKPVGEGRLARTAPNVNSIDDTFNVGMDIGTPVSEEYHSPFKFTDTLEHVTIELK